MTYTSAKYESAEKKNGDIVIKICITGTNQCYIYLIWLAVHVGRLAPRKVDGTLGTRSINTVPVKRTGSEMGLRLIDVAYRYIVSFAWAPKIAERLFKKLKA